MSPTPRALIEMLEDELVRLEEESAEWKEKYFALRAELTRLRSYMLNPETTTTTIKKEDE